MLIAARELAPAGMDIDITDLSAIPLYNTDVEAEGDPPAVGRFKAQIAAAGALLIATPEYNHLMSGVLKNAIDWGSLPAGESVLKHKPAAVMGPSSGVVGTARAQLSLRQVLASTECYVLPPNPRSSSVVRETGSTQTDVSPMSPRASGSERCSRHFAAGSNNYSHDNPCAPCRLERRCSIPKLEEVE